MNPFETFMATSLATAAFIVALGASPETFAQDDPKAGHHGNHHQAMRNMQARELRKGQTKSGHAMHRMHEMKHKGPSGQDDI